LLAPEVIHVNRPHSSEDINTREETLFSNYNGELYKDPKNYN